MATAYDSVVEIDAGSLGTVDLRTSAEVRNIFSTYVLQCGACAVQGHGVQSFHGCCYKLGGRDDGVRDLHRDSGRICRENETVLEQMRNARRT